MYATTLEPHHSVIRLQSSKAQFDVWMSREAYDLNGRRIRL
jgi:hypothetical protein